MDDDRAILERLKRARAYQTSASQYVSFAAHCELFIGANRCLRTLEHEPGRIKLVVVPRRVPSEAVRVLEEVCRRHGQVKVWSPNISGEELAKCVGVGKTCLACGFSSDGADTDPLVSIREAILNTLSSDS